MALNEAPRIGLLAIRVSTEKQGFEGDSPEAQREQGERFAAAHNIVITETVILMESASHDAQPMQQVINRCKDKSKGVQIVLIKSIDRFTRGGADYYGPLKRQLTELNVSLVDMYGVIGQQQVNTLEHLGFTYYWSKFNPSQKTEMLEAERAKDEMRDIMTRVIGDEIRYTQLGYWMRQPPHGYVSEKIDTANGKRLLLRPHPTEAQFMIRLFELRAEGIKTDQQIADELNRLGFRTRLQYIRAKHDKSNIVKQIGNKRMTAKMVDYFSHKLIYVGVIKEKWTNDEPIKAQFDGLVPVELFNKANRGKLFIEIDQHNIVAVRRKRPPEYLVNKNMHNPEFPYKKVVTCPTCGNALLGSASKGKMGKYYPAYHCTKHGHYFRVPKDVFEQTVENVVKQLQIAPDRMDELLGAIEKAWHEKQAQTVADDQKLLEQRTGLETQIKVIIDRMRIVTSETAIKYMEEDIVNIEKQLKQLDEQQANKTAETVDMAVVLQYARYLVEHLGDILLHLKNPLRKAAFFGAIFDSVPSYADLVGGTQKTAQLPGVNELFRIGLDKNPLMVNHLRSNWNNILEEINRWYEILHRNYGVGYIPAARGTM